MNLGSTILNIRKQMGYTQISFASKCNITQSYLSQIENNKREPNIRTLRVISSNLSVPLPFIIFLSMNETDIDEKKLDTFKLLNTFVKNLISDAAIVNDSI